MAHGKGTLMRVAQPPKQVAGHGMRPTKFWSAAAAVLAATLAAGVLLVNGPHSGKADAATPTWQSGVYGARREESGQWAISASFE